MIFLWVVFLGSAITFALAAAFAIWIINKIVIRIQKDNDKYNEKDKDENTDA